jgi:uracil-DNA glycosylase
MDSAIGQNTEPSWTQLKFWNSGEYQVIEERLDDLDKAGLLYNPERKLLFHSLSLVPIQKVKVLIVGQDPYPERKFATGVAFSIDKSLRKFPPTLKIILDELNEDLHIVRKNGSLEDWCKQGVLLWNAVPSCLAGRSLSHDWTEWSYLTQEIVVTLAERGIVFAFLGSVARRYAHYVTSNNAIIETGHPSPRGNLSARIPFTGSRLFSTINAKLVELGHEAINWGTVGTSSGKP